MTILKKIRIYLSNVLAGGEQGISLYLSIVTLAAIFAISFGLVSLLLGQLNIARDVGRFIPAIYATDAGIERALYKIRKNGDFDICTTTDPPTACEIQTTTMQNDASYRVIILDPSFEWCDGAIQNKCIRSIGNFRNTNRVWEVTF